MDELICNLGKLLPKAPPQNTQYTEDQDSLVGKAIRHKWCSEDGMEQWYTGRILSGVEGTTEWFYDGEDDVLTLNLYDVIENGDLEVMV